MWRVIAIRAASIWRLVTYAGVSAWMPYSPNDTSVPPVAWPERPGWCCLRYLTLRGMSITPALLLPRGPRYGGRAGDDGRRGRHGRHDHGTSARWPARARAPCW